jgi:hypothetical protein
VRNSVAGAAFVTLFAISSVVAQSLGGSPPEKIGPNGADVRPGNVGPVSPTSATVPMDAQPPADIPANSGSSGASMGESGSPGPYNPTEPQN